MPRVICAKCQHEFESDEPQCPRCGRNPLNPSAPRFVPRQLAIKRHKALPSVSAQGRGEDNPLKSDLGDFEELSRDLIKYIFSMLDERGLGMVSKVCRKWRELAGPLLMTFLPETAALGSTSDMTLKNWIKGHLAEARTLEMAVDQFPTPQYQTQQQRDESILGFILKNNIELDLSLGTSDRWTEYALQEARKKFRVVNAFHKMHNKIWVINKEGVIVGSPNVSFRGLEGGNLESCIYIKSPRIGWLYGQYLKLLKQGNRQASEQWGEVKKVLTLYNKNSSHFQVAFAPIVNVTDFVVEQLGTATKIIIRQFLISPKKDKGHGKDIVSELCLMARAGIDIEIYIDAGAYRARETKWFVQPAAQRLIAAGCKVFTQERVVLIDARVETYIQHDKLILATLRNGVCRTLIGSAGFTKDVIANTNAENFISTDVESIHDALMAHHLTTLDYNIVTTRKITSEGEH